MCTDKQLLPGCAAAASSCCKTCCAAVGGTAAQPSGCTGFALMSDSGHLAATLSCSSPQGSSGSPLSSCPWAHAGLAAAQASLQALAAHPTLRATQIFYTRQLLLAACSTCSCMPVQDWQRRQPAHWHWQLSWPQSKPNTVQRLLPAHPPGQVHALHGWPGVCAVLRPGPHSAGLQPGAGLRWAPSCLWEAVQGTLLAGTGYELIDRMPKVEGLLQEQISRRAGVFIAVLSRCSAACLAASQAAAGCAVLNSSTVLGSCHGGAAEGEWTCNVAGRH